MKRPQATPLLCLLLFLLIWSIPACDNDNDSPLPVGISGLVVDNAGNPVADVAIGLVYSLDGVSLPGDWEKDLIRPFDKPATRIGFALPEAGPVTLEILDYAGNLVRTLMDGEIDAGEYTLIWDATDDQNQRVPAGVYFARLTIPTEEPRLMNLFLYLYEDGEILLAPHAVTGSSGRFTINGALIPVGAQFEATDETGQVTGTTTVRSAILVKAVIAGGVQPIADAKTVDWLPGERLGGLKFVLP